ncbi:MAG: DNA-directed polymerase subunit [Candidatus Woesearchaeota archaeon]|nr:DNA-directed polymerase subunit [Candidatus Woesearchaeota archaeon]MDN5327731.1 DNA-directed polymerase subunit [Candidatus Woesearchaeota archaeon]
MVVERKVEREVGGFKMQVELFNERFDTKVYLIKGVNAAFVNSIRRAILAYVPTLAIEEVDFYKNSSPVYNEVLAHRLGLLPLITDLDTYEIPPKDVDPRDFAKYHVAFKIKKTGPCVVRGKDIEFNDPKIKVAQPEMPIVTLLEGQELEATGIAVLGIGKEHAKWSPAHVYYKNYPQIKVKKPTTSKADAIVEICPKKLFKIENSKLKVDEGRIHECSLCRACVENFPEEISFEPKEDEFLFSVESFGQLPHKVILEKASEVLTEQLNKISKLL